MSEENDPAGWPLREFLGAFFDRLERRYHTHSVSKAAPWGYVDVLEMVGGSDPGGLVVLTASPRFDEESAALRLAHRAGVVEGLPVLLIATEWEEIEIAERLVAIDSGIPQWRVHCGYLSAIDWSKIGQTRHRLADSPVRIDEIIWHEPWEVADNVRQFCRKTGSGCIVLDAFTVLAGNHHDCERASRVSDLTAAVRDLARELTIPLVTLRPNDTWLSKEQRNCSAPRRHRPPPAITGRVP
jgi:replicative DNA helicase